jgi:hypothetical protein
MSTSAGTRSGRRAAASARHVAAEARAEEHGRAVVEDRVDDREHRADRHVREVGRQVGHGELGAALARSAP